MRFKSFIRSAARFTAILAVAACADQGAVEPGSSPVAVQPESSLLGLFRTEALTWNTPVAVDISNSKTIGSKGGKVEIKELGFVLTVPQGAVKSNTTFKVTAVAGNVVAFEFEPHGAVFDKPLTFSQNLGPTSYRPSLLQQLYGGYFADRSLIDQVLNVVYTIELIPDVKHFSGYMVSAG
jgi:hypothetical protein